MEVTMETSTFEERLKKLSAITGQWEHSDAWSREYEAMLNEVKEDRDQARRIGHAMRLLRLLDHQLEFMMNSWVAESRRRGMN